VATPKLLVDRAGLSKEQFDLIQQFEADYNAVDHFLRKALGSDKQVPFTHLISEYAKKHAGWCDSELLKTIAEIRNAIVHGKTEAYRYVAIPTPAIAEQLRTYRERLINPARAVPTFQRTVEAVSIDDTLSRVLKIIDQRDYSQFPVYNEKRFRGLLTENGITRWLAHHVIKTLSLVELDDIPVGQALQNEEAPKNYPIRALAEGVLSNVENVPTSGNAKKLFCFFPIRRNEHSFQQRLLREQGTHIVHSHIA